MSVQTLKQASQAVLKTTLDLVFPATCRICDQGVAAGEDFCPQCDRQLRSSEWRMVHACRRCGRPGAKAGNDHQGLQAAQDSEEAQHNRSAEMSIGCAECRHQKLAFDRTIAMWTYDGLVRDAVVATKYGTHLALADALGRRLAGRVAAQIFYERSPTELNAPVDAPLNDNGQPIEGLAPDWVSPVPSHFFRRIQRSGGGSRPLARTLASDLLQRYPSARYAELLTMRRRVKKQAWLGESERFANVRGAFRIKRWAGGRRVSTMIQGSHVLLVDDVMTTGATANENALVLKRAGAAKVTIAVVARAMSS